MAKEGPVQCHDCGWDDHGKLRIVDWYAEEHPPIPPPRGSTLVIRGDDNEVPVMASIEECWRCGVGLSPETVLPRVVAEAVDPQFPRYRVMGPEGSPTFIGTTFDGPRVEDGALVEVRFLCTVHDVPDDEALADGKPILLRVTDFSGPKVVGRDEVPPDTGRPETRG